MTFSMDEEILNPSGRGADRKVPDSAWHPKNGVDAPEAGPVVHDHRAARPLEELPTEPIEPGVTVAGTAVEPVFDLQKSNDALEATVKEVASDETQEDALAEGLGSTTQSKASLWNTRDRFQPIRLYARGGMGMAWVARDCELHREVALNVIEPRFAERPEQRSRFVLEAEITGKLEHPGVAPIYSLGQNAEGRLYYAMRFVRGESLAAVIKRFHKPVALKAGRLARHASPFWGIEFRQLLGSFLDVCNTIDYAHSRGVLHRDLKPANIILGRYGETLVVEWGLAKVIDPASFLPERPGADFEPSFERETPGASGAAEPGILVGTPAYMSPEQASGAIDDFGVASDVYSLGATLYELLTGDAAFRGDSQAEVLDKARNGSFPPPRSVCRFVPAPLEAICCKAMARQPEQRFARVRELARDVEHWLADEPVTAYREGNIERLGRWVRRHRTWVYSAFATIVGIGLMATAAAVVIEGSRQREAEARREAESNFRMAQDAVDDYLTNVSENTLLKQQDSVDIRNLRQDLLTSALRFYQQFVDQRGQDPGLRQELANAYFRVGEITKEIASPQEAIESLRSAQTIWERLAAGAPWDGEFLGRVAACQLAIGKLEERIGNLPNALKSLSHARAILEPLAAQHPDAARFDSNLAECLVKIGIIHTNLESPGEGLPMLQRARAIRQRMVERSPNDSGYKRGLAEVINDLGYVYYKSNDDSAALAAFQEVQKICQSLLEQVQVGPKPVKILEWLARSYYNVATIQLKQGEDQQALRSFEQSLDYRSALVAAHPSVTTFQADLGASYREIASRQHALGQDDTAIHSAEQAIEVFERLAQLHPDVARYRSELGRSYNALGCIYDEKRENLQALSAFLRAVAEEERAAVASKDFNEYKALLATDLENLGEQYIDLGQIDEGLRHYRRALETRTELHLNQPMNRQYTLSLVQSLSFIGAIERQAGRPGIARASLTQARQLLEQLGVDHTGETVVSGRLGAALVAEAVALAEEEKPDAARTLLGRAIDILTPLGAAPKAAQDDREQLSEALWQLARLDRGSGKSDDAARIDAWRLALWKDRPAKEIADLALKEAGRATLIGYGKTPVPEQARSIRNHDLDLAAADFRLAISQGFKDLATFRSNPDSSLLLARDDVKSSIKDLEAAHQPAGSQLKK
jgi:serine/threonine-protein kinase